LLSVAAEGIGGSSAFLTIPGRNVACSAVSGARCNIQAGQMCLAGQTIDFKNSSLWKGPISKGYRCNRIKSENIAAFKAVLDRKAAPESAWRYIQGGLPGSLAANNSIARCPGLNAIRKLKDDPQEALNLIGLGQGLTPAGDDMLVGYMAITNHTSGDRAFVRKLHEAVSESLGLSSVGMNSVGKTSDISAQALQNALDYDYHEYIQNCIRDVCEGEKEAVYISALQLINIGATSGSDIATGMYFGMFV
jgi:hypothetical protein